MQIGDVDLAERVLLVAEVGNNHEGELEVARQLVHAAAGAGADAVKFQTFRAERLSGPENAQRLKQLRRFELSPDAFAELAGLAHELGLLFLSTPLDLESVEVLEPLVDALKIASGDNDFVPLLERVGETQLPVLVSGGLVDLDGLRASLEIVRSRRPDRDDIAVLHCVAAYPAPSHELNLRALPLLARALGCTVGYSDHALGIEAATAAVALGARIVEKHFTLANDYSDFRDHALSLTPMQFAELVSRVRALETMLGSEQKEPQPSETPVAAAARRSAVASRDLRAGDMISAEDVVWLRPAGEFGPGQHGLLVGRVVARGIAAGSRITARDLA